MVFEAVTGEGQASLADIDMERMRNVVDRRLNAMQTDTEVSVVDGSRLRIGIYGRDPADADEVRARLAHAGKLEFRIAAARRTHPALIEQAESSSAQEVFEPNSDGEAKLAARWVRVRDGDDDMYSQEDYVVRTTGSGDMEVLVVMDSLNVTGDYLDSAVPTYDSNGQHAVSFSLNRDGARRFDLLTGQHTPRGDFHHHLGIILDDVLYTAPRLSSRISDSGIISGNFTAAHVARISAILSSGMMPAPLREISCEIIP